MVRLSFIDSEPICSKLCDPQSNLLPTLSAYLASATEVSAVTENIFYTLVNICADQDANRKNFVIEHSSLVDFLDLCAENLPLGLVHHFPWALKSLMSSGMTHCLDKKAVIPTCLKLLARVLCHLLSQSAMQPACEEWTAAIKHAFVFIEKVCIVQNDIFTYSGDLCRQMVM